jgi:hypothetical protein
MSEIISTSSHWIKKGMILWRSNPAELCKVIKVIDRNTLEVRSLRFYERWFYEARKWFDLKVRNPFNEWRWKD